MENMSMLAQALKNQSLLDESKIIKYEENALEKEQSLYQYLFLNNIFTEQQLILTLAKEYNYTYLNIEAYDEKHIPHIVNMQWYKEFKALPIYKKEHNNIGEVLYIVTSNIDDINKINEKTKQLYNVDLIYPMLAEETSIIQLFDFIKNHTIKESEDDRQEEDLKVKVVEKNTKNFDSTNDLPFEDKNLEINNEKPKKEDVNVVNNKEDSPLTELLQKIILDAINSNVSDIHLEPFEETYKVRFRQNDELYEAALPPSFISKKMTEKIKNIAKIDINESNIPQLGRISIHLFNGQDIDFRVSTFPTKWGEKIVMSLQNPSLSDASLTTLGLNTNQVENIEKVLMEEKGIIVVGGDYRSGKTTTCYNLIKKLNGIKSNVYAFENTSTLKLKNINQIYFPPDSKMTRRESLGFVEFQDPDVIFIDDTKKDEVDPIVALSKNKGRNIIISLNHKSLKNIFDFVVEESGCFDTLFANFSLLSYQHKISRLCEFCKTKDTWSKQSLLSLGFSKEEVENYNKSWSTYSSIGCPKCNHKKYNSSIVVFEILHLNDELKKKVKQSIDQKINIEDIKNYIMKQMTGNIKEEILKQVKKGIISVNDAMLLVNKLSKN